MNRVGIWIVVAGLSLTAGIFQARASTITVYTDAPGGGGDFIERGFYITNYAANNLSTVTLYFSAFTGGQYSSSLTARLNTFNGSIIGTTQQATFSLATNRTSETAITFDFGGAAVPVGSTITFTQVFLSGPGDFYYDTGTVGPTGVFETVGTSPPLDSNRGNQVGTTITALGTATPEPSSLVLLGPALWGFFLVRRRVRC